MLRALRATTSRLLRLAAVLATIAQLAVAGAPVADLDSAPSVAHIEAGGTSVHFSHDEAICPVCALHHLIPRGERREQFLAALDIRLDALVASPPHPASPRRVTAHPPRAPPVVS